MSRVTHSEPGLPMVRNTLDGCQATNTITDTGIPRSRESSSLVYLSWLLLLVWLSVCFLYLLFRLVFLHFTLHLCHSLSHAQSFSVLTACQRACLGITDVPSLVSDFAKRTHARFEWTLTCLVLARLIFSRKKRCILWLFKLTSDLFLLVNKIRNWRILRLY